MAEPKSFWKSVNEKGLAQGDLLQSCFVPHFPPGFGTEGETDVVEISKADLIIVTQSCDLKNNKVAFVAMCPVLDLTTFEGGNSKFKNKGEWENVRKGRVEGLHLLSSPTNPKNNRDALVVDFGHIISLPIGYLNKKVESLGPRWRLDSPYLEHFSQSFARFFMRVGLPSSIPSFS